MNDQLLFLSVGGIAILNFVAMIAGIFVYWRKGGNMASNETIAALETLNKTRKEELIEERRQHSEEVERMRVVHEREVNEMTKRIDDQAKDIKDIRMQMQKQQEKYEAILIEKDKQISGVTNILQNRNPESQAVTEAAMKFMRDNDKRLGEIHRKLLGT